MGGWVVDITDQLHIHSNLSLFRWGSENIYNKRTRHYCAPSGTNQTDTKQVWASDHGQRGPFATSGGDRELF